MGDEAAPQLSLMKQFTQDNEDSDVPSASKTLLFI
jgi:hypothetical protein